MVQTRRQAALSNSAPPAAPPNRASRKRASNPPIAAQPLPVPDLPSEILLLIMKTLAKAHKSGTLREFVLANKAATRSIPEVWIPIVTIEPLNSDEMPFVMDTGDLIDKVSAAKKMR